MSETAPLAIGERGFCVKSMATPLILAEGRRSWLACDLLRSSSKTG
jgi:hypothetical protein